MRLRGDARSRTLDLAHLVDAGWGGGLLKVQHASQPGSTRPKAVISRNRAHSAATVAKCGFLGQKRFWQNVVMTEEEGVRVKGSVLISKTTPKTHKIGVLKTACEALAARLKWRGFKKVSIEPTCVVHGFWNSKRPNHQRKSTKHVKRLTKV